MGGGEPINCLFFPTKCAPFRRWLGWGGVSLKTDDSWGSEGSCHSDSASKVGVGSLQKQIVVGVVRVVAIKN